MGQRHLAATTASVGAMGLTRVMLHALNTIASHPPGPMSQLSANLRVDAAWVTAVVDRLESRGYVVRVPSPVDRRVKILELTDAGRAVKRRADRLAVSPPPEFTKLSTEDLETLVRIGDKLALLADPDPGA